MKQQQTGATLIEAMVAVLIIGFGLLGVGAMQTQAVAMNQNAYYRGVATDLATDLAERVRAMRTPFIAGADTASEPPGTPNFAVCTQNPNPSLPPSCGPQAVGIDGTLTNDEMRIWDALVFNQMPSGTGWRLDRAAAGTSGYHRYTLTLTWPDSKGGSTPYSVVIE